MKSRTPQGVRGLKQVIVPLVASELESHSARSAWIETNSRVQLVIRQPGRTPQGVRGLKPATRPCYFPSRLSHSARSAWIEKEKALRACLV